jgi:hypothetical protein
MSGYGNVDRVTVLKPNTTTQRKKNNQLHIKIFTAKHTSRVRRYDAKSATIYWDGKLYISIIY